ncbi:unnamed protein product [Microthlaspi erraticum]|uniref:Uncharacterized protein n=1 Tax=Microthlaspi erraticum TaxID=1685480 RepID=A0A6D2KH28_9BRAS|nr:unnamed protein product [Microthlaspi erraticum]
MASTSQFLLDDQTDEDFFDKLVDDAYSPSEAHASSSAQQLNFDGGSDSDDARAFANLSVVDDSVGDENGALNEADGGNDVSKEAASSSLGKEEPSSIPLGKESDAVDGSGSPGVKEVDWGSFYADHL